MEPPREASKVPLKKNTVVSGAYPAEIHEFKSPIIASAKCESYVGTTASDGNKKIPIKVHYQ